jgi:hypothetical protein
VPRAGSLALLAVAGLASLLFAAAGCTRARDVMPVYLTWSDEDTSTTMTVNYHTRGPSSGSNVYYDTQPRHGEIAAYAGHARGFERSIEGVDRTVHVVPLSRLSPGTTYWFVAGDPSAGFTSERSFRTLPGDDAPITFVAGGDMSTGLLPRLTSWQAARTDPDFALLGGDIAYCGGRPVKGYERWQKWFADWEATMHTAEGRLIPMVVAVGNHDRARERDGYDAAKVAPYFSGFLYQDPEGHSYFARRFGPRMAVFVLDSGHLAAHDGAQRDWLEAQLRGKEALPVKFALYHVALYPAAQPIKYSARMGRKVWVPLFERYGLSAAFENHGHLHKRTFPLREDKPVSDGGGIVYFGDGLWGKERARHEQPGRDYLAITSSRRHFWKVTVSTQGARYEAIDGLGRVFDHAAQDEHGRWLPQ